MKQQILHKYTELSEKSHLHFAEQVKTYLETEEEKNEIVRLLGQGVYL